MILVDTSVWVEHLRKGNPRLAKLLENAEVACHPFVIGELACGNLKNRKRVLTLLQQLPSLPIAEQNEVLEFIEKRELAGAGIGWIDAHLLASVLISDTLLWTLDKRLVNTSSKLNVDFG